MPKKFTAIGGRRLPSWCQAGLTTQSRTGGTQRSVARCARRRTLRWESSTLTERQSRTAKRSGRGKTEGHLRLARGQASYYRHKGTSGARHMAAFSNPTTRSARQHLRLRVRTCPVTSWRHPPQTGRASRTSPTPRPFAHHPTIPTRRSTTVFFPTALAGGGWQGVAGSERAGSMRLEGCRGEGRGEMTRRLSATMMRLWTTECPCWSQTTC
mmetsp:Transcript_14353/g.33179  ORF Transcript_14353/g.33179 Transcript_14353/m.33179 type:complete len:212 (-) Transcript_14353:849-1484(-)